jgi:surface polysaccharide O-acyltransferase-like enzyme
VGAVLAGLLVVVIITTATDALLHATGIFPSWGQPMSDSLFVLAFAYRIVYGIVGGYITARLAPDKPVKHAIVLGAIGFVLSLAGAAATWNRGPEFGPKWYPLALIAIAIPTAWLGGKLVKRN